MEPKRQRWRITPRTWSNLFVVCVGIAFYLFLSNFDEVRLRLNSLGKVIQPFVAGFALAYLLNIPASYLEKNFFTRFKFRRMLSILTSYLLAVLLLAVLLSSVVPQVVQSVVDLVNNSEGYINNLNATALWLSDRFGLDQQELEPLLISYQDLLRRAASLITAALPQLLDFGMAVGNGLVTALTAVISSVYMLTSKHALIGQMRRVTYALLSRDKADRVLRISRQANEVFSGFIAGKIIESAIIGVLCFAGMTIFRMQYALLISVVVGVTDVIPFFGPFIGAIPSIMILLIVDPWDALYFGIFVLALQQFDGNILGPKILGDSTGLSPIWVLVAIIVGGGLFGFAGMLLGVPTFAVLYALTREWVTDRLRARGLDEEGRPLPPAEQAEKPE